VAAEAIAACHDDIDCRVQCNRNDAERHELQRDASRSGTDELRDEGEEEGCRLQI
jgi:hypothetical protein